MKNNNNFINDLNKAKIYENMVKHKFEAKGYKVELAPDKYFPDYDMLLTKDNTTLRLELKVDYSSYKTGNACFEYSKIGGHKSGCTAGLPNDLMMFIFKNTDNQDDYIIAKRKDIYEFAKLNNHRTVSSYEGNTLCYLVKKELVFNYFNNKKLKDL